MYVSAPGDPSPPSTSNFIPELPRKRTGLENPDDESQAESQGDSASQTGSQRSGSL